MKGNLRRVSLGTVVAIVLSLAHEPARPESPGEKVAGSPPPGRVEMRLPPDLLYDKKVGPEQAVTFRHSTHVTLTDGNCVACHPAAFSLLRPVREASHETMDKGGSCGSCHDGKNAFATADDKSCATCHSGAQATSPVATGEGTAAAPTASAGGPKDVTFRSSDASPSPVVFRHSTHKGAGSCKACHPSSFAMKAGGTKTASGADLHGKCGTCHDGKTAFGVEDGEACMRCHAAEGAKS